LLRRHRMSELAMNDDELTEKIIACAFRVHKALGQGFSERVYENAMRVELVRQSLKVRQQVAIQVYYEGEVVGEFVPDLWVEERVLVELKAVLSLQKEHEVQLVNYLTATKVDTGLLINFGASVEIRRKFRTYKPKTTAAS
jgi:GxxExxY protein